LSARFPDTQRCVQNHIYHCRFPDAVVILDLVPDRYRLLQGSAADRFMRLAEGTASSDDITWLSANGIPTDALQTCMNAIVPPTQTIDIRSARRVRKRLLLRAIWMQQNFRQRLRKRPLHQILQRLQAKQPLTGIENDAPCVPISAAFERAKQLVPTRDQCLPRALAMTEMLFDAGIKAQLVFGVTLPFSAHCWVQRNDVVLSDSLDRVRPFKSIMVLG
jgi:hypothetical protein